MIINRPIRRKPISVSENCLRMQLAYLQVENERLQEKIDNFNKALEILGGVK